MVDIIIIGAGVIGSSIAKELSRFNANILILEANEDVCTMTSKANSGIIHAGYDAPENSLMAKLNVESNHLFEEYASKLNIPYKKSGSFVIGKTEEDLKKLELLYQRGINNGVKNLEIITDVKKIRELEPNINEEVTAVLYAKDAYVTCPFELTIALAESAVLNGAKIKFNEKVIDIIKTNNSFKVITKNNNYECKYLVNAAGIYSDKIDQMLGYKTEDLIARKGDYFVFDKDLENHVNQIIFSLPNEEGKGILVAPTAYGNLILGPTAEVVLDKEDTTLSKVGLNKLLNKKEDSITNMNLKKVITSFSGMRAINKCEDFIIEKDENYIKLIGISSPGLTSSIGIGLMIKDFLNEIFTLKDDYIETRKGSIKTNKLTDDEYNNLIKEEPKYGNIVCRCEKVSEQEIINCLNSTIPATSLDGIKRRTRTFTGRCQGGFCLTKVIEIMKNNLNYQNEEIVKSTANSRIINGYNKESL